MRLTFHFQPVADVEDAGPAHIYHVFSMDE
jgi:hypothetical protein